MRTAAVLLTALVLLAGCGDDDTETAEPAAEQTDTTVDPNDALADGPSDVDDETRAQHAGADALDRGRLNQLWDDLSPDERAQVCDHTRDVGVRDAGYEMTNELQQSDVWIAPAIVMQWMADECNVDWDGQL